MSTMPGANFTHKAQQVVLLAQKTAQKEGHQQIDSLHLLKSLLIQEESIVINILERMGVDIESLGRRVDRAIKSIMRSVPEAGMQNQLYLSQDMAKTLKVAGEEAEKMGDKFISIEHLFLSLLSASGYAKDILESAPFLPPGKGGPQSEEESFLDYEYAKEILEEVRGGEQITDPNPESTMQVIDKYTNNLTEMAREGKIDPVVERKGEMRRIMQVLSRRTKNNPVLIGEAGVGKTAIVEGLAQRIAKKDVPESLKNKEVISLDLGSLVAGTRYRGEFENRMKALLKELKQKEDKYIMFIDELHTLIGTGAAEGSVDASNLLKPDLARGKLRAIGATTLKEYQKYIERDTALERRFQPVFADQPSIEETVLILRGIKEKYELHHGVKVEDGALRAAAELSSRYITDRYLPDKAVDLMDEAMSSLRLEVESQPSLLEDLKRDIQNLEIEKEGLKSSNSSQKERRKKAIERELADLKEKASALEARWSAEKDAISRIKNLKNEIDELKYESERAGQEADLQRVAEIKYAKIPTLMKELKSAEKKLKTLQKEKPILKESVTEEDVAGVVSRWTGIPVTNLLEEEVHKLERMEKIVSRRIVGQEEAISAISNAIRRSRAGVAEEGKPLGSFLFLGPTGVGKTETARALAEFLFDKEDALVRLDMSEYMEKHSVSKMVGAPPGYVGYEESGQLSEIVRKRPYSVILIDEMEKAHPEVFNVLLQVLEDGRLTDSKGRTVSFKNSIIIMTSNAGSEHITDMGSLGFETKDEEESARDSLKDKVMEALKKTFRPEFLNRVDDIIIFNHLSREDVRNIVSLELERVKERVEKSNGVFVDFKKSVEEMLSEKGFDHEMGARPLKRMIQTKVLNPLALSIISGDIKEGERVSVKVSKGEVVFNSLRSNSKPKERAFAR